MRSWRDKSLIVFGCFSKRLIMRFISIVELSCVYVCRTSVCGSIALVLFEKYCLSLAPIVVNWCSSLWIMNVDVG